MIDTLLIYAAGFGKRMLPLTADCPKPLLTIKSKPILYHVLDLAQDFGFKKIFVNAHYLANKIEDAVKFYIDHYAPSVKIQVLKEDIICETGGTIKKFYNLFEGADAIFTANSDSLITTNTNIWQEMLNKWDNRKMDFLMLVSSLQNSFGSKNRGDFDMDAQGKLSRNNDNKAFMFCGIQILKPDLVANNPEDIFSLALYYTNPSYKIFGHENSGNFYHVSNPIDYQQINELFAKD